MRYRFVILILFAALPMMQLFAAPAPDPSAILELGLTPPKGWSVEQYLNEQIKLMTSLVILDKVCSDPEVKKLPSVASMKDARSWLAKNIHVKIEKEKRRLFVTFRAGKRNEQVTIINALLRVDLSLKREFIKTHEKTLHRNESIISKLESRNTTDNDREMIHSLRTIGIPELHAEIARLKQAKVIKWAK
jgi:hypothetical protein